MGYGIIVFYVVGGYIIRTTVSFLNAKDVMSFYGTYEFRFIQFVGIIITNFKISSLRIPGPYFKLIVEVSHALRVFITVFNERCKTHRQTQHVQSDSPKRHANEQTK